jgi:UDP-N-acetyl-D-glucosamine dehydrogenase
VQANQSPWCQPLLPVAPGERSPAVLVPAGEPSRFASLHARIADRSALVGVVGLGYVGLPLLVEAARRGFPVVGIDADASKVAALTERRSHVADVADDELASLPDVRFGTDPQVLHEADVLLIAVPTPLRDGSPDLSMVDAAAASISAVLRSGQLVVLESTTYPGTTEDVVCPILERSGLVAGRDFALAYSPERIDPGSSHTLRETPKIVAGIGADDTAVAIAFYETLVDRVVRTSSPRAAEMAKLIENIFRQVNIALVNELATVAPEIGVDIWEALDAAATKPFGYMPFWPGPGVGGHCIAVDPSYLSWKVEQRLGFGVGFIEHARAVNNRMPAYVTSRIAEALNGAGRSVRGARLVLLGLTYKAGVNDVRESPALAVLERLLAAGADVSYHDPYVPTVNVVRRRPDHAPGGPDGELISLSSVAIDEELFATADCVVILTAHPGIDHHAVVAAAPLVFDAVGVTRANRSDHIVLL